MLPGLDADVLVVADLVDEVGEPHVRSAEVGESAELRRLRQQLAQVTMERDVLKKALAIFSQPTK